MTPRASFAAWVEKVKDQARPWNEENEESAQYLLFHFIKGIFSKAAALAEANRDLERVTRAKDEVIALVSHELRTPLCGHSLDRNSQGLRALQRLNSACASMISEG